MKVKSFEVQLRPRNLQKSVFPWIQSQTCHRLGMHTSSRRSGITLPAPSRAHISSANHGHFLHAGPTRKRMVDFCGVVCCFCGDVVVVHFYNRRHEDLLWLKPILSMCRASMFSIGKLPEKKTSGAAPSMNWFWTTHIRTKIHSDDLAWKSFLDPGLDDSESFFWWCPCFFKGILDVRFREWAVFVKHH